MAENYGIRITPRALRELESIFHYVQQDSPQGAAKMIGTLMDAIDSLETFPRRHALAPGQAERQGQIRSMVVRPYVVRYRVQEETATVYILGVRHGARKRPT